LKAWTRPRGLFFFAANKGDPRQQHIFSVQLDGSGLKALTTDEGIHAGNFSGDGKHYAHMFGAERSPSISLCAVGASCSPVWQARDEVTEYGLRKPKYLEFKADDGTTLYGQLLLPPDAPASGKIPLIVYHLRRTGSAAGPERLRPNPFDEILARKGFASIHRRQSRDAGARSQIPDRDPARVRRD
jgi:dipeptidyl-peptidase 4